MTIPAPAALPFGFSLWDFVRAVKCSDLPPVQRHLLHVMALTPAKGSDGVCAGPDFSYPRLAASTGYTRCTVVRNLAALGVSGWLDRRSGGPGRRNSYGLRIPAGSIHNPSPSDTGSEADTIHNPSPSDTGTRLPVTPPPSPCDTPSFPLLTKVPSIDQSVRARVRFACPELTPDDDDLARMITNLETRKPKPVRNVAAYLQTCPPADIRRLIAEAKAQVNAPTSTNQTGDEAPAADCVHGFPAGTGLTTAGTPRCPQCRAAAQLSRSQPFRATLDGHDRPASPDAAQGLSAPIAVGVTA